MAVDADHHAIQASPASTGSVKITMALKNLSTISRNITLLRFANVNNGPVATNDEFVSSFNSAFGEEPGEIRHVSRVDKAIDIYEWR
jgi:hypothetical protein